jgi:hypothetical protein
MPVNRLIVHVPSSAMEKDVLHTESLGSIRQGPASAPDCSPVPVASALVPMTLVKVVVEPGRIGRTSEVARGAAGDDTSTKSVFHLISHWSGNSSRKRWERRECYDSGCGVDCIGTLVGNSQSCQSAVGR